MHLPDIATKPAPDLGVADLFSRFNDLAYNLAWSWSPRAHQLFSMIDPSRWRHYQNPIELLIRVDPERWNILQEDPDFCDAYHTTVDAFDRYMRPDEPTWFARNNPDYRGGPVAYFSTEYGWHHCLQTYSGGLGVLSGDHCKSASDLGLPFVGVGLMYKHGYFRQTIDADGHQQHLYPNYDLRRLPVLPIVDHAGREVHVPVDLPQGQVQLRVWLARIGRVGVMLLDSDLPVNNPADRSITSMLYVRGREMRLCQELVLGIGGARLLDTLGIRPEAWHINEGHSALLTVERARTQLEKGVPLDRALDEIASRTIFTTHTPVPAGNEVFDRELVREHLAALVDEPTTESFLELGSYGDGGSFNMTALALRSSARSNGVSRLHGEVANGMWRELLDSSELPQIEHVTNGVHLPTWLGPEIWELLQRKLGDGFEHHVLEGDFTSAVEALPDYEIWAAHSAQKRRLIARVRDGLLEQYARHGVSPRELRQVNLAFDPEVLTIGFARRFATYKRADLLLRDFERLKAIACNGDRPIQFFFAGSAHPADRPGQKLIKRIYDAARDPDLRERLTFIESYNMGIARSLVQGVDVWLNTPKRPLEASGTSGMKAAMNGVLNCSILDGWWCEGYTDELGWVIGDETTEGDDHERDQKDADALYDVLENRIAALFYTRDDAGLPTEWIARMKRCIGRLTPSFSSERMVRDYAERYYLKAAANELAIDPVSKS